ncbi:hypothetical protein LN475_20880 [Xanthomonas vesicatoria]|uniref:Histidine kinase n=2 Tax=Xanthomonas vesicatoria TaxID=56460 RepID=F0B7T2_9XANT|nr:hypothetical protein [Xanthomonas vesicatoria]EGD11618.1 hypothetical protein XVE_0126 [Xanthomonas vesicatoria ATCC 35937]KTF32240.1 hypothetical protein LMG920_13685 [Xanthomonas vesicatoria]KTF37704.1 hypothetical protein LMG919_06155 [Xanthomonas vesicatoria]MCC8559414.1 hypothetical protein [Xanthomonas vesicatoria]MCC8599068.1 hypothetical protein [Xanthomonas vesicatoria]
MTDVASQGGKRELLHQLRNRLNVMGFALYALRDETSKPLETLRHAHQSAIQLLNELGEQERAQELADSQHAQAPDVTVPPPNDQ